MKQLWLDFKRRPVWRKICDILLVLFALAGVAIIGAWALYQLGVTNNRGAVDENHRYLQSVSEMPHSAARGSNGANTSTLRAEQVGQLSALARLYPDNALLILQALAQTDDPTVVERMMAAAQLYIEADDTLSDLATNVVAALHSVPQQQRPHLIPWMQTDEWAVLRRAIESDSALIREAGRLAGVEPRLIAGCLIGEQMRLFGSNRELIKRHLGPVKMLGVQSQFSYGVNGIKDKTAIAVEEHLKDPSSPFYMGPAYEHLLDFTTADHTAERYRRLVDYDNHLYSYLYTACILHQTMLQWRRAGYDISNRPEILFTLFNLGFAHSDPKPNPMPGGSNIKIGDRKYTFGALGFDFYYSGELLRAFPYEEQHFVDDAQRLTADDVSRIQAATSDCTRPERGLEYRRDTGLAAPTAAAPPPPDPFGINPETATPISHTAQ